MCLSLGLPTPLSDLRLETVCLIGGGPSLRGFDLSLLDGRMCIAVNDAIRHISNAALGFSLDLRWMRERAQDVAAFAGVFVLALPDGCTSPITPSPRVAVIRRISGVRGLSRRPSHIYVGGGNSGFGAFNLACLLGARRIFLFGYDLCHSGSHWHSGYAWRGAANDAMYRHWAEQYRYCLPVLATAGIEVINASLDSMVSVFPRVAPMQAVEMLHNG